MKKIIHLEKFQSSNELEILLLQSTGVSYVWSYADSSLLDPELKEEEKKELFQIMPKHNPMDPFFYWYCEVRRYHQFFDSQQNCLMSFMNYYLIWLKEGKPDYKEARKLFLEEEALNNAIRNN